MNYLYQLLIGIASGCVAAWVTTFFALKRFYSEKWWEKRAAAFIEITGAVYQLKILYEYHSELKDSLRDPDEDIRFVELKPEQLEEMEKAANEANKLIAKYSQVGPLLLTERASDILRNYLKEVRVVDYDVHYRGWDTNEAEEHLLTMVQKLLEDLMQESRKELKAN
ncbi:hypothetical protein [Rahnella aceris]|jgi:hypothetical protein